MHYFAVRTAILPFLSCITCLGDAPLQAQSKESSQCKENVIRRKDFYGYDILLRKTKGRKGETHYLIFGTYQTNKKVSLKKRASVPPSTSISLTQFSRSGIPDSRLLKM